MPARGPVDAPASTSRFPDGVAFRIEIPSVEGPACLDAVLEEAAALDVPVRRLSGGGVSMLTDAELDRMAETAADAGSRSACSRVPGRHGAIRQARSSAGAASRLHLGGRQLRACLDDAMRAAEHGFRGVLITDLGALGVRAPARGSLPSDMQAKVSVMAAIGNPATARRGRTSVRTPERARRSRPRPAGGDARGGRGALDLYVESPDDLGGLVRLHDVADLIQVAAVYVKLGLRNAPALYPWGQHLGEPQSRWGERVRRARIVMERLERAGIDTRTSVPGAEGLAVPCP